MNVQDMIRKSRIAAQQRQRTQGASLAFLQRANILDANGHYKEEFFSEETVAKSRANTSPSKTR